MKRAEFKIVINASKEKTWEVLFNQYGDIYLHNPNMQSSKYMHNAIKGELNCVRYCKFNDKLFLEGKITEVNENNSFNLLVTEHNLPFVKELSATYVLSSIGNEMTEVKMTSSISTSPGFIVYLMKGQMGKTLIKHLFGLKYYIETGKAINKDNYSEIFKSYKR